MTTDAPADSLQVVLSFPSADTYRAVGADLATVRKKLGLPAWTTPTEVIAASLREQASEL